MGDKDKVIELIECGQETDFCDFKREFYHTAKKADMIKDILSFANSTIDENNLITETLNFEITSENTADLSKPILYNNCANPIVLSYVNDNIKSDYTITDTSIPIVYDGSLLQRCNITLESISCTLSFDINITNNKNQKFKATIYFDIH